MDRERLFGENFKRFRKRKGISQKEFAQLLFDATGKKLTLTSVSNYETGLHMPPPQILPVIAEILEVSIDALFGKKSFEDMATTDAEAVVEEETVRPEPVGPDVVKEWKQELELLEREFIYWKARQGKELIKEKDASRAVEFADRVADLARKQQDELIMLQRELATIKEILSIFRE